MERGDDESHTDALQRSVRRTHDAGMFALSTNNNPLETPNAMNKMTSSLLAAVFTLAASASFASSPDRVAVENALTQSAVVADASTDHVVVMEALATRPDGSKARTKTEASNMAMALIAYQNFIRTLPYGSTLLRVTFTDGSGQVLFTAQG